MKDLLYAIPTIEWSEDALSSYSVNVIQSLKDTINSLNSPKRTIMTNFIELSPKISIGVKGYKLFNSQGPTKMTSISRINNKLEFVERRTLSVAVVSFFMDSSTQIFTESRKLEKHWKKKKLEELSNLGVVLFRLDPNKFSKFDIWTCRVCYFYSFDLNAYSSCFKSLE